MAPRTDYRVCHLCEAMCGLAVEHEGGRIVSIRGDVGDAFSKGHICPKGVALMDVQHDPDRLRKPMKRVGDSLVEVSWEQAFEDIATRLARTQLDHGPHAVGFYYGNPTGHSYAAILFGLAFSKSLGTKNVFSANSVDALPRLVTSLFLYGNQAVLPIPDLDRTSFLLILGANPVVSNGSVMTAPGAAKRLAALRARGGTIVVVDPRRTETAEIADRHLFVRPGTDALLLAAMLQVIFVERLDKVDRRTVPIAGEAELRAAVATLTPSRVASRVGIEAGEITRLARDFAGAPSAVCYGRLGTCVQEFGTLSSWLVDALNLVTGNLDRVGGAMFPTPAVDLAGLATAIGQTGTFDRYRSRASELPEFNGELPVAAFAEEMETPGAGQIRALVTHAGNPVLSLPNGRRVEAALEKLDFMVSIDIYRNETTRHADYILPPTWGLEHEHYPMLAHALAVRNTAHYSAPLLPKAEGALEVWEILLELSGRVGAKKGGKAAIATGAMKSALGFLKPRGLLSLLLRVGPHKLSLRDLEANPHGIDLGPLVPRLSKLLATPSRAIELAPPTFVTALARLASTLDDAPAKEGGLLLIGRRTLRSNNSWMHNSHRLVKGRGRCTLLMHPADAKTRGLASGAQVELRSRVGSVEVALEISDELMPGTVSLPHGWGHHREGTTMGVAAAHAGVSANDVTDDTLVDRLSGASAVNGVPVQVLPVSRAEA